MRYRYLFIFCFLFTSLQTLAQYGEIVGTIQDETKEPVIGATVIILSAGIKRSAATTDIDGNYVINALSPGSDYELRIAYPYYITKIIKDIIVRDGVSSKINIQLNPNTKNTNDPEIIKYKMPLLDSKTFYGSNSLNNMMHHLGDTGLVPITAPGMYVLPEDDIRIARTPTRPYRSETVICTISDPLPQGILKSDPLPITGLSARYENVEAKLYDEQDGMLNRADDFIANVLYCNNMHVFGYLKPNIPPEYLNSYRK